LVLREIVSVEIIIPSGYLLTNLYEYLIMKTIAMFTDRESYLEKHENELPMEIRQQISSVEIINTD
jgi:hypothetical protein